MLDIDGTIINKAGCISDEDKSSLNRVVQAGIKVCLCTGRVFAAARYLLEELSLEGYHIFFDGALVCNAQGKSIYSQPIPPRLVQQICNSAIQRNILLDLYSINKYFVRQKGWRSDLRYDYFGIEAEIRDFSSLWRQEQIFKGSIVFSDDQERRIAESLISEFTGELSFIWSTIPAYPGCHFVNILDKGLSKGGALKALVDHYSIKLSDVMAIGDGANDIPLLTCVGTAVAMSNAPDELKESADYITSDVENHGVTEAILKFIF